LSPPDPLRRAAERPVFAEPWQAQAFALALELRDAGHFTWGEWTEALAAEIAAAEARGEPEGKEDDGTRYYDHWLAALERLVVAKGLAEPQSLAARRSAWEAAYRATPHGKPVELKPVESKTIEPASGARDRD
jgi:nitrile hydratase accessory protein